MANVDKIHGQLETAIARIRSSPKISKSEIDKMYTLLVDQINSELRGVKQKLEKQRIDEEKERMRKLQEEMELERKRKEEEERRSKELEIEKQKKVEIESKRKIESEEKSKIEDEFLKKMEEDRLASERLQHQLNAENQRLREQLEQVSSLL